MTTNALQIAEQERHLADAYLRVRGVDTPTVEQLEAACAFAASQERGSRAGHSHGFGTIDGTDYDVDAESAALDAKTRALLRVDGKLTWTEEEYFAAAARAAQILGIDRSHGRAD